MDFQTHSARKVSSKLLIERVEGCSFTCITSIAHRVVEIKTKKFIHTVIFFDCLLGTLINSFTNLHFNLFQVCQIKHNIVAWLRLML